MAPVSERFTEGDWSGEAVWIVGGGPSLRGFDFEFLKGERVVAINSAHTCGVADVVFTGDARWLLQQAKKEDIPNETPVVYCGATRFRNSWQRVVYQVEGGGKLWGRSLTGKLATGDSGLRAVNFAAVMGAEVIYLLGFDMHRPGGEEWWHAGYDHQRHWLKHDYRNFLERWEELVRLDGLPCRVLNLTPGSLLSCVPRGTLHTARLG
jgi:hypothetical protein